MGVSASTEIPEIKIPDNIPVLNIGNRQGSTDYIDFITYDEVTSPIMTGVDKFNRRFIVIKAEFEGIDKKFMQTFFQRYTDGDRWISDFRNNFIETVGGMTEDQMLLIQDLLDREEVVIEEKHNPTYNVKLDNTITESNSSLIGKKIILKETSNNLSDLDLDSDIDNDNKDHS